VRAFLEPANQIHRAKLYMLYLADEVDAKVVLINYRPATPPTPADSANWQLFLEAIRWHIAGACSGPAPDGAPARFSIVARH
jgi:hypothetical protein